ncbi:transposase, partial [Ostertagia ostertagi]
KSAAGSEQTPSTRTRRRRRLQAAGLVGRCPAKKPLISEKNRDARVKWAQWRKYLKRKPERICTTVSLRKIFSELEFAVGADESTRTVTAAVGTTKGPAKKGATSNNLLNTYHENFFVAYLHRRLGAGRNRMKER